MARCSNSLLFILNIITLVVSIPIIGSGIWLSQQSNTQCEKFLVWPVVALGVFVLVVSLAGLIGSCCKVSCLLWLYLFVMVLLIVLLGCFSIFALVVTNKGAGDVLSGRGYKEYRLGDYSNWLQKRVNKNWGSIGSCLADSKICQKLTQDNSTGFDQFYKGHLSSVQSGCCKPADECNFEYVSPTNWTRPANSNTTNNNPDCKAWSNNPNSLCYNCQSCKAGLLDNIKRDWKKVAILNFGFLALLIIITSLGCCAFSNNRKDNVSNQYP